MTRAVALLCILIAAAGLAAQRLPKVRLPGNVPGAGRVNSLPTSPRQAANRAQDAQVQELMRDALATDDPEEQARIYTKILLIDPNNQVAYNGRRDALEKLENQQADSADAELRESQAIEESLNRERDLRQNIKAAEAAYLADDVTTAAEHIEVAEDIAPTDPQVVDLGFRIRDRLESKRRMRWLLISVSIVVGIAFIIWLVIRIRQRDPYLMVVIGPESGRRVPFDGEILRIGAVPEDDQGQNDLVIPDPSRMISRFHCEIHRREKHYYLIDLGSTNGTYLNNRKLKPGQKTPIKRGARFRLGDDCVVKLGFEHRS